MPGPKYDAARLEWGTRFAYPPDVAAMLRRFCGVRPGMGVVELGCGSGVWGRVVAEGLRGRGALVGVDLDPKLVARARAIARAEGLRLARYRVGDATGTRLPSGSADLVTCHRLLCVVPDPAAVVREMARLARRGGLVVANEHDHSADVFWEPDDPELAEVAGRRNAAWLVGFRELHGGDHSVGAKLASLFTAAGLRDVRAVGVLAPSGAPPFDERLPLETVCEYYAWLAEDSREPDAGRMAAYRLGGWTDADERAYLARVRAAVLARLESGDLRSWGRVNLVPRVIVRAKV